MSFLQDVFSIFKKRDLAFIESRKETEDVYSFLFEQEKGLTWKAGQHGLFSITHKPLKNAIRPFTLASAPAENVVKITTRISEDPSDYKKALLELQQGMKISMSGPVGSFYLKDNAPSLLIAGGIGITPFRSMLKHIEKEGSGVKNPIHLLYMDSGKAYLYQDELDIMASHPSVHVTYLDSKDGLHQEIEKLTDLYKNNGKYYVAGPKSMVDATTARLQDHRITKRNIKKDAFWGY